ncbi:disease resistance protein Roq1-like isoform X2 [Carya illinoinensis]|uniref:disease resistance protein Roq1-like isoform X2 n=1 Tax=Carya illinoinensis TaxID=32201 RepID=UPI001C72872A|nr:disease resistance protein Roq1-like isoform X2 [Carya illinoinensis]
MTSSIAFPEVFSSPSSSNSPFLTSQSNHDVFLSFRGEHTRYGFIGHLYHALTQKGINTYKDDKELRKGEKISPALSKAIEESEISIVIFSKDYASSTWCLDELLKILECKESKQQKVLAVYYKVEPSTVRHQKESFEAAFAEHEKKFDDAKVQRWKSALNQTAGLCGFHLKINEDEYEFIQKIVQKVSTTLPNLFDLHVAEFPVGIQSQVEVINELLCIEENDIRMIGIFGSGGIGKTTIAKAMYNLIAKRFEGRCFLANVRESSKQDQGGLVKLQQTILSDILKDSSLKVSNVDQGINLIMKRLCHKRVLLVLDDVDCLDQLKKLCGRCDWFGSGSRIIITTRDGGLLTKHHVHFKYRMKEMDHHEALQLFSHHAFKSDKPNDAFEDVIKLALKCAAGLPLALQVIGSNLCGEDIQFWKSELKEYKRIPEQNIYEKLKISYDGLDHHTKEIFLDIACFFKGGNRKYVTKILDGCGFNAYAGVKKLNDKCLITIDEYDRLMMNDLLEDMGKEIVRQESPAEPGKRSRLWFHEDVLEVLEKNKNLTSIDLSHCEYLTNISDLSSCSNLEKLSFHRCTSLVEVHDSVGFLDKLVELDFSDCFSLKNLPRSFKLRFLKLLKLDGCNSLENFPEIECEMKYLERVELHYTKIQELPSSITYLTGLNTLYIYNCDNLVHCPVNIFQLEHLQNVSITCCPNFVNFGKEVGHNGQFVPCTQENKISSSMELLPPLSNNLSRTYNFSSSLRTLNLSGSGIVSLPPCIEGFVGLSKLDLTYCTQLEEILHLPPNVEEVCAEGCSGLKNFLPESNNLSRTYNFSSSLRTLNLSGSGIVTLPPCIEGFVGLSKFDLTYCTQLEEILHLPPNVEEVYAEGCFGLKNFLPESNNLSRTYNFSSSLRTLNLSGSDIVTLPPCIERFVGLSELKLKGCNELEEILHLPPNIKEIHATGCESLKRFPHLSTESSFGTPDLKRLTWINLSECNKMHVNVGNHAPDPLMVQERFREKESSTIIYPGSRIPEWFKYCKETTSYTNSIEIEIDHNASMCGHPIVALVLCSVVGPLTKSEPILIKINGQLIKDLDNDVYLPSSTDPHRVWLRYIAGNSIDEMLPRSYREGNNNMRFTFEIDSEKAFFKSAGVHLIYGNDNLIDLNNQCSKRYRDDGENDLEPDWNPQKKRRGSSTASSSLLGNESKFMEQIVQEVSKIVLDCTYLHIVEYPVGIKSRVEDINMLLCIEENDVRMIGIFGIGGIGKTTIAKEMYNRITNQFEGSCFLANVRESSKQDKGGLVKLQKTILSDILKDSSLKVSNVDRGINLITERLCHKKILLVLDDVDHLDQLKKLCGRCDWFGSGSRIIITTRDEGLLTKYGVSLKYPMKEMDHNEALQLFTQHAFKSDKHIDGFADLLEDALHYAGGLPLALKVIGSNLYGEDVCYWKSELEKYKRIPEKEIQEKLKISYDGLDDSTKKVFLDIACFFKGDKREYVTKILDSCGFSAYAGIKKLNDKCLITIDQYDGNQYLWMHDLLQDMGREIVRQESPEEPGKRSRLWFDKDVREVLEKNKGTEQIEGILIDLPSEDCMIRLGSEVFAKMESLRILKIICCSEIFCGGLKYLSNELRVLDWLGCSLEFLPSSFHGKKLIVLNIRGSNITDFGTGLQSKNLTRIDLSYCRYLTNISDLSSCPNLEELVLDGCTRLVEVHDSVGFLDKLVELRLEGCSNFKKLPSSFKLRSLELLELEGCTSLENFPEIECEMEHLKRVVIESTVIQGLPSSITYLTGLEELFINGCKSLVLFPINIFQLEHLKDVTVIKCPNFENFGQEVGHNGQSMPCTQENKISSNLAYLNLSDCGFVGLPPCIEGFVGLSYLHLRDCKQLEEIVHLPPNLEQIDATGCVLLQCFPHVSIESSFGITELKRLKLIHLSECNKVDVNVGNQAPDPLLVRERFREKDSSRIIYPGSRIPEWFKYCKESTSYTNSIEIEIDTNESICFGYQIMALVLCFVLGPLPVGCGIETITISINGQSITHANIWPSKDQHRVLLQYIAGNSIDQMVSRSYREGNNMRFTFGSDRKKAIFKSAGVHLIYRNDNLSDCILPSSIMLI